MDAAKVADAAALLYRHRAEARRFTGFPEALRPRDEHEAYGVQAALGRLTEGDEPPAGYKIGATTPVMQAYLGIDHPCAGRLANAGIRHSPADLRAADFQRVGVECEIAVRLAADLPPRERPHDPVSVAAAVGACMAAIEIVDDRYVDYRGLDAATLIADQFFHAGCVLGPEADWRSLDLAAVEGVMTIDGVEAGRGIGADVLGHPFAAVAWLADHLGARGDRLRAGQLVLTGSIVEVRWPRPGSTVAGALAGLGRAEARIVGTGAA